MKEAENVSTKARLVARSKDMLWMRDTEGRVYCIAIETLEGTVRAQVGDYIIKGVKGEIYPCKPDIFEATYDPA